MRRQGPDHLQFWILALIIGIAAGFATLAFRVGVYSVQELIYGEDDIRLASAISRLPWYWVLGVPAIGGVIVGAIMQRYTRDGRNRSVAHVIKGAVLNDGRVEGRAGLASAVASFITLSTGGSTGREGPVVHLAAVISSKICRLINADGVTGRDLMGCAVAAAVAASFNAPIAGTIFAMEVVLRHYAVHAFGPIVISAVCGALISRIGFGDITEFILPAHSLEFYVELPAFFLLGLLCGLVSVVMMRSIFWATDLGDDLQQRWSVPAWLRPGITGVMLGAIAIAFPHIIGVGYETTSRALTGNITFWGAVIFAVVKVAAVAITVAGRMGGGVFSPALMLGALTGLSFGWVATSIFPTVSGSETLYALAGMGAVGAAVLGAPISTSLIVFEMTGDWQLGIAVMIAVAMSSTLSSKFIARSFFLEQLERWDVHLAAGPQAYLLGAIPIGGLLRKKGAVDSAPEDECLRMIADGVHVIKAATLEVAFPRFEGDKYPFIPVVEAGDDPDNPVLIGALFQIDALKAYNDALSETAREEHS
ncbi:MAG: chloride channel protein [Rhodobacteraceae bacterium]|nr:chloride channel protein [Paracoccaceae bacterium]